MTLYILLETFVLVTSNKLITDNIIDNIFNIFVLVSSTCGIVFYYYLSFTSKDISKYRGLILLFSILFFIYSVISGILSFIVYKRLDKREKRELPKLEIMNNYKWYIYLLVLALCLINTFVFVDYYTNSIQLIISYLVALFLLIFIFRKDLLRDLKEFKKYFREYNSYVLSMYVKSLAVLFILSLSIKLAGVNNATNQETIQEIFNVKPIQIALLSIIYAPISEEIMFRGIFRKFIDKKWLFIISSGLLFGAAHVIDDFQSVGELLYILVYGSLGCFLAAIYYKTNNLCTNMYFHFIQNSLSIVALLIIKFL